MTRKCHQMSDQWSELEAAAKKATCISDWSETVHYALSASRHSVVSTLIRKATPETILSLISAARGKQTRHQELLEQVARSQAWYADHTRISLRLAGDIDELCPPKRKEPKP